MQECCQFEERQFLWTPSSTDREEAERAPWLIADSEGRGTRARQQKPRVTENYTKPFDLLK